ncbi:CotH kinase family protein, partial [Fibrobacter sp.]|uniref:CotH kinase family protein n=1 Tax=Fibrobacter sp. TaxID=35828 RepID=UPI0025C302F0
QDELKKRWAELRSGVWHTKVMDAYLDSMKTYLTKAADRNFKRWPNLGQNSGQGDKDPEPMKYCNGSGSSGMKMGMGGNNANTWDGEVEHLRKKMKERMQWMDQKFGFTEPANPVVTEPVDPEIHDPHWQKDTTKVDTAKVDTSKIDTIKTDTLPPKMHMDEYRLSPTNFYVVNGNQLEIYTTLGGKFALVDLNGAVLFKTQIKAGESTLQIPAKARDKHWIATLNGKMLSK